MATLYDDNVLRSSSNEESSFSFRTTRKVLLEGRVGRHDFLLGYEGEYASYLPWRCRVFRITYLVADADLSFTDYTDPAAPLDNWELETLVGVAWRATARTSGEVKVGFFEDDFDDPGRNDFSEAGFDFKVEWSPRSYSVFTAYGSRGISNSGQGGGSMVVDTAGLRWRHGFSSRLLAEAGFGFQRADFESNREDDLYRLDLAAKYRLNRFLQLRGGFEYLTQSSNDSSAEYDDSNVFILCFCRRMSGAVT